MKYLSFILVLLFSIAGPAVLPHAAFAEDGWVPVGPPGGQITELRVHPRNPRILWAGTYDGGVFKSVDGGSSWSPASRGLDRLNVQALAVAPSNPSILYAASGGRFYRSSNGGQSWTVRLPCGDLPGCLPLQVVLELVVDPRDPQEVFAVTFRGLFKTVDGGVQWRRVPKTSRSFYSMVFEPGNPKVAYAAAYYEFFKSTDGGASWVLLNKQGTSRFEFLVIDPKNPRRMWTGSSNGILRSSDGGRSWQLQEQSPYQPSSLALTPASGSGLPTLWVGTPEGIYRSLDGGATWKRTLRNHWANIIATHPQAPDTLWAGVTLSSRISPSGIFKSVNRGASWTFSSRGIYRMGTFSLAFDPVTPGVLWTASIAGVLRSADGGLTWTAHNRNLSEFQFVTTVAVDPDDAETVWIGTSQGAFVSEDGGGRWLPRSNGLEFAPIADLRLAPSDPSIAYAVSGGKLFRTADAGRRWTARSVPQIPEFVTLRNLWIDPQNPNVLVAAWRGLWISRDAGGSWTGMPVGASEPAIWSLAVDPRDSDILYAGGEDGVFRSADGGQVWELVADLPVSAQVALAVGFAGEVWAGDQGGIYFSPDGVSGWTLLPGLVPTAPLSVLAADPHHPSTVFAGAPANTPAGFLDGLFRHTGD